MAYRSGVTSGVVAPKFVPGTTGFLAGLSTAFSSGARHKLEKGAILQDIVAFHVAFNHRGIPSVSTQIAALRHLLISHESDGELSIWLEKVKEVKAYLIG